MALGFAVCARGLRLDRDFRAFPVVVFLIQCDAASRCWVRPVVADDRCCPAGCAWHRLHGLQQLRYVDVLSWQLDLDEFVVVLSAAVDFAVQTIDMLGKV